VVVVAGLVAPPPLPKPVPEGVDPVVVGLAVVPPPLPEPVPEGVDPAVELEPTETGYPAFAQSASIPDQHSSSEKVY